MNFRGVTWNLNGTRKFLANTAVLLFLSAFGIIFLQETFEIVGSRPCDDLNLPGFIPRERRATRGTRGRGKGGLKTLLNGRLFGHGLIDNVSSLIEDILVVRWSDGQQPGLLLVNVYVPRHADDGK
jgi:hypothetical protein